MIIVLGFYKRRSDITHDQFLDHWKTVHGPLAQRTPGITKYLKRYVQHHLIEDPSYPSEFAYDGFSEAWFESIEARDEWFGIMAAEHREIFEDEARFIDPDATRWVVLDRPLVQIDVLDD